VRFAELKISRVPRFENNNEKRLQIITMSPDVDFADNLDQGAKMAGSTPQHETSTSRSNKLYVLGVAVACGFLLYAILPTTPILGVQNDDPVLLQQELENSARFLSGTAFPNFFNAVGSGTDNTGLSNDVSNDNKNTFGFGSFDPSNTVQGNTNNVDQSNTNVFGFTGFDNTGFSSVFDSNVDSSGSDAGVAFDSGLFFGGNSQFGEFGGFGGLFDAIGPNNDPEDADVDTSPSFLRIKGPFEANLTLFNEDIVGEPYAVPALLREDLENNGRFLLNIVVKRNTNVKGFENVGYGSRSPNANGPGGGGPVFLGAPVEGQDFAYAISTAAAPVATGSSAGFAASSPVAEASAQGPAVGNNVNDFGTNNQETDVEEGDVIVSDGERGKWFWAGQSFPRVLYSDIDVAHLLMFTFFPFYKFSLRCLRRLHFGLECEERGRNTRQSSNATH
jgi:hypothetical protein